MTITSGAGYALVALGPGLSLFVLAIASKPLLVLAVLTSTVSWLVCLVTIAALWRGFLPLGTSIWPFVALLSSAVVLQEGTRFLMWQGVKRAEAFLDHLAETLSKPRLSFSNKTEIAIAVGFGHGLSHSIFFCLSLLTPALGPATFYLDSCPQMPFFLVLAALSMGFFLIHTFSMVIAFHSYEEQKRSQRLFVPLVHLVASFLTMINLKHGGCGSAIWFMMACAALILAACWRLVWDKTRH